MSFLGYWAFIAIFCMSEGLAYSSEDEALPPYVTRHSASELVENCDPHSHKCIYKLGDQLLEKIGERTFRAIVSESFGHSTNNNRGFKQMFYSPKDDQDDQTNTRHNNNEKSIYTGPLDDDFEPKTHSTQSFGHSADVDRGFKQMFYSPEDDQDDQTNTRHNNNNEKSIYTGPLDDDLEPKTYSRYENDDEDEVADHSDDDFESKFLNTYIGKHRRNGHRGYKKGFSSSDDDQDQINTRHNAEDIDTETAYIGKIRKNIRRHKETNDSSEDMDKSRNRFTF